MERKFKINEENAYKQLGDAELEFLIPTIKFDTILTYDGEYLRGSINNCLVMCCEFDLEEWIGLGLIEEI